MPDKAALMNRNLVREAVQRSVLDRRAFVSALVTALAAEAGIPEEERAQAVDYVGREILGLHEGTAIRYRLLPANLETIGRQWGHFGLPLRIRTADRSERPVHRVRPRPSCPYERRNQRAHYLAPQCHRGNGHFRTDEFAYRAWQGDGQDSRNLLLREPVESPFAPMDLRVRHGSPEIWSRCLEIANATPLSFP